MAADMKPKRPTGRARTAAKLAATSATSATSPGPVESSVEAFLAGLDALDAAGRVLAAAALSLAKTLDAGPGMSAAAIARQLELIVDRLGGGVDDVADVSGPLRSDERRP